MISYDDLTAMGYYAHPTKEKQTLSEMVEEYRVAAGQDKDIPRSEELLIEEYQEWFYYPDSPVEELKELADLVYVAFGLANANGWDLEEAVKRVHENNMGRMKQPDGTIQYRSDGKVLKNKDYPKVNLKDLV